MPDSALPVPTAPPPTALPEKPRRRRSSRALARNAKAAFFAGASGAVASDEVNLGVARVRRGARMAAPHIMAALVEKAVLGRDSPANVEACKFLLKGTGVMQDAAPITEKERLRQEAEIVALEQMPALDLEAAIFDDATLTDPRVRRVKEPGK